ncbi:VOC family protein [Paenibacillus cineris]|uniref:Extradiol dioxygenase n=1 Tax=Paenibacillus cineris TaxID=237530 RepID=A0ABQ4LL06_9BACL|nr:VOC family protein [Paenibacillus cineris]GIO56940.1 extradiol dioxygenase [Paenibacillus cineris]
MSDFWKPKGYSSVSPYLVVPNAQSVINFLQEAFGATELRRFYRPDGSFMHVELQIEDTVVMLGDATNNWCATIAQLHIYVQDVIRVHQLAVHAGGTSILEPTRKEGDPDRRAGVKDPAGNTWWIATQEV